MTLRRSIRVKKQTRFKKRPKVSDRLTFRFNANFFSIILYILTIALLSKLLISELYFDRNFQ